MNKTKRIFLSIISLLLIFSCLFITSCEDIEFEDGDGEAPGTEQTPGNEETPDGEENVTPGDITPPVSTDTDASKKPSYIFSDITVTAGAAVPLLKQIKVDGVMKDITYSTASSDIKLEAGSLTGVNVTDKDIEVKAVTDLFEAVFKVKVSAAPVVDYGQIVISVPGRIYSNYPAKDIGVTFTNPSYTSNVTFTTNNSNVSVSGNKLSATGTSFPISKNGATDVTITATTEHHSASATVKVSVFDTGRKEETHVAAYEQSIIKPENKGGIIFVGDSYFDGAKEDASGVINNAKNPDFWTDFYTDYSGRKAFLMGISGNNIEQLEVVSERLVYPMEPSAIVVHIGFNDVHHKINEKTAVGEKQYNALKKTADDIQALLCEYRRRLPDTKVYYMGLEPKKGNTAVTDTFYRSNTIFVPMLAAEMQGFAAQNAEWCTYVDTGALKKTIPDADFYNGKDASHLSLTTYDKVRALLDVEMGYLGAVNIANNSNSSPLQEAISYNGAALVRDYVIEGKIKVVSYNASSPHFQLRFGQSGSRFIVWDSNKDGKLGIAWVIRAGNCGLSVDETKKETESGVDMTWDIKENLIIDFKMIVTDDDAHMFFDGKLVKSFEGMTPAQLYLGAAYSTVNFYDMRITEKNVNYNAYLEELAKAGITY